MRLLFVADGRSPIARNWIGYWIERGNEVHLVSSFPCKPLGGLDSVHVLPVAFSGFGSQVSTASGRRGFLRGAGGLRLRQIMRHWFGPLTLTKAAYLLGEIVQQVGPDLVHAMRIPFEGMMAAGAELGAPLVISVWGNDFTLHARSSPWMAYWTRKAMFKAVALHTDCRRDQRLAEDFGFSAQRSSLVIPGNGGVQTHLFFPASRSVDLPVVFNPRGFRSYVRNDTFFRSIPIVLKKRADAKFLCAAMADERLARKWVERLHIQDAVNLLPSQGYAEMGNLFRFASVMVSPSLHDGTPNSLLEAMACGCLPVVGDIDSLREWITPGINGLLMDARNPAALAEAVLVALENHNLRQRAAKENHRIILERAEFSRCMAQAESFYSELVVK